MSSQQAGAGSEEVTTTKDNAKSSDTIKPKSRLLAMKERLRSQRKHNEKVPVNVQGGGEDANTGSSSVDNRIKLDKSTSSKKTSSKLLLPKSRSFSENNKTNNGSDTGSSIKKSLFGGRHKKSQSAEVELNANMDSGKETEVKPASGKKNKKSEKSGGMFSRMPKSRSFDIDSDLNKVDEESPSVRLNKSLDTTTSSAGGFNNNNKIKKPNGYLHSSTSSIGKALPASIGRHFGFGFSSSSRNNSNNSVVSRSVQKASPDVGGVESSEVKYQIHKKIESGPPVTSSPKVQYTIKPKILDTATDDGKLESKKERNTNPAAISVTSHLAKSNNMRNSPSQIAVTRTTPQVGKGVSPPVSHPSVLPVQGHHVARVVQGPGQMCGKGGSMKSPVRNESRIAQNVRKGTQEGNHGNGDYSQMPPSYEAAIIRKGSKDYSKHESAKGQGYHQSGIPDYSSLKRQRSNQGQPQQASIPQNQPPPPKTEIYPINLNQAVPIYHQGQLAEEVHSYALIGVGNPTNVGQYTSSVSSVGSTGPSCPSNNASQKISYHPRATLIGGHIMRNHGNKDSIEGDFAGNQGGSVTMRDSSAVRRQPLLRNSQSLENLLQGPYCRPIDCSEDYSRPADTKQDYIQIEDNRRPNTFNNTGRAHGSREGSVNSISTSQTTYDNCSPKISAFAPGERHFVPPRDNSCPPAFGRNYATSSASSNSEFHEYGAYGNLSRGVVNNNMVARTGDKTSPAYCGSGVQSKENIQNQNGYCRDNMGINKINNNNENVHSNTNKDSMIGNNGYPSNHNNENVMYDDRIITLKNEFKKKQQGAEPMKDFSDITSDPHTMMSDNEGVYHVRRELDDLPDVTKPGVLIEAQQKIERISPSCHGSNIYAEVKGSDYVTHSQVKVHRDKYGACVNNQNNNHHNRDELNGDYVTYAQVQERNMRNKELTETFANVSNGYVSHESVQKMNHINGLQGQSSVDYNSGQLGGDYALLYTGSEPSYRSCEDLRSNTDNMAGDKPHLHRQHSERIPYNNNDHHNQYHRQNSDPVCYQNHNPNQIQGHYQGDVSQGHFHNQNGIIDSNQRHQIQIKDKSQPPIYADQNNYQEGSFLEASPEKGSYPQEKSPATGHYQAGVGPTRLDRISEGSQESVAGEDAVKQANEEFFKGVNLGMLENSTLPRRSEKVGSKKSRGLRVTNPQDLADTPTRGKNQSNGRSEREARRHTVNTGNVEKEFPSMRRDSDFFVQKEAFLHHLAERYPEHASTIQGTIYEHLAYCRQQQQGGGVVTSQQAGNQRQPLPYHHLQQHANNHHHHHHQQSHHQPHPGQLQHLPPQQHPLPSHPMSGGGAAPGSRKESYYEAVRDDDRLSTKSDQDSPVSGGFTRGGRLRSSLPIVRSPNKTMDKPLGLVFLIYRNETKRGLLPNEVTSLDTIKALFVRAFCEHLSMRWFEVPGRKIYMMDLATNVYFELEDLRDIKDRSVLKIYEPDVPFQSAMSASPRGENSQHGYESDSSVRSAPPMLPRSPQYSQAGGKAASLPAQSNYAYPQKLQQQGGGHYSTIHAVNTAAAQAPGSGWGSPTHRPLSQLSPLARPGQRSPLRSPVHHANRHSVAYLPQQPQSQQLPPQLADSGGYLSNMANNQQIGYQDYPDQRSSGSVTPSLEDSETRERMQRMEAQLASLAAMVQTAVVLKHGDGSRPGSARSNSSIMSDASDSCRSSKELETGNPIVGTPNASLDDQGPNTDTTGSSVSDSTTPIVQSPCNSYQGISDSSTATPQPSFSVDVQNNMRTLKQKSRELRTETNKLRRLQQANNESMQQTIYETFKKIKKIISQVPGAEDLPIRAERENMNVLRHEYQLETQTVSQDLSDLALSVDELRQDVLKRGCRINKEEIQTMALALSSISKSLADLKGRFPHLHDSMKTVMASEMQVVVKEEKFLKQEPDHLDEQLKKCDKLVKVLVTLKRLGSVQEAKPALFPSGLSAAAVGSPDESDRRRMMDDIVAMVPDHNLRVTSVQATEAARERKKKIVSNAESLRFEKKLEQASKQLRNSSSGESQSTQQTQDKAKPKSENRVNMQEIEAHRHQQQNCDRNIRDLELNLVKNVDIQNRGANTRSNNEPYKFEDSPSSPILPLTDTTKRLSQVLNKEYVDSDDGFYGDSNNNNTAVTSGVVAMATLPGPEKPPRLVNTETEGSMVDNPARTSSTSHHPDSIIVEPAPKITLDGQGREADDLTLKTQSSGASLNNPDTSGSSMQSQLSRLSTFGISAVTSTPNGTSTEITDGKSPGTNSTRGHVSFSSTVTEIPVSPAHPHDNTGINSIIPNHPASSIATMASAMATKSKKIPPPPPPRKSSTLLSPTSAGLKVRAVSPPTYENIENFPKAARPNGGKEKKSSPPSRIPQIGSPTRPMTRYQHELAAGVYSNMNRPDLQEQKLKPADVLVLATAANNGTNPNTSSDKLLNNGGNLDKQTSNFSSESDSSSNYDSSQGTVKRRNPSPQPGSGNSQIGGHSPMIDDQSNQDYRKIPPAPPVRKTSALSGSTTDTISPTNQSGGSISQGGGATVKLSPTDGMSKIPKFSGSGSGGKKLTVNGDVKSKASKDPQRYNETEIY